MPSRLLLTAPEPWTYIISDDGAPSRCCGASGIGRAWLCHSGLPSGPRWRNATALDVSSSGLDSDIAGGLERRADPPADDALIRRYEVKGRTLYTDLMLANIAQHDQLVTAGHGGAPDPYGAQWQRGFDDNTPNNWAAAQAIGKSVAKDWSIRDVMPSVNALDGIADDIHCLLVGDVERDSRCGKSTVPCGPPASTTASSCAKTRSISRPLAQRSKAL